MYYIYIYIIWDNLYKYIFIAKFFRCSDFFITQNPYLLYQVCFISLNYLLVAWVDYPGKSQE